MVLLIADGDSKWRINLLGGLLKPQNQRDPATPRREQIEYEAIFFFVKHK